MRGPVFIIAIDRLLPVAARNDVVDGAGKYDAKRTGHGGIAEGVEEKSKT
jgi:hypothetical protein